VTPVIIDDELVGTIEVFRDITRERTNEQDLQKFQRAVAEASDHVVITDPEGKIIYMNSAAEKITGYSQQESLGKKAGSNALWGGLMGKDFYQEFWSTIKKVKKSFTGVIKNKRKDGQIYDAAVSVSPILDNRGNVQFFVGIERDVSKELAIDRAKTEFVSLASHQLRTPLSAINWYTEMLLAGDAGKLNKEQRSFLDEIYHSNQRMVSLVNSLLNVSRLELGTFMVEPEKTDICEIADSVIGELQPQIKKKNQVFTKKYEKKIQKILLDKKLIRMVIQNLLTNAVKYTKDTGKVTLAITQNKKDLLLSVSDTGMGIPKSQQSQIFKKLFRADNVREADTEGTGLGLYIVKAIVAGSGGTVRFESEENKGTTFFVTIPLTGMAKKEGTKTLA
jgi:PAS domain S-box-containing protein